MSIKVEQLRPRIHALPEGDYTTRDVATALDPDGDRMAWVPAVGAVLGHMADRHDGVRRAGRKRWRLETRADDGALPLRVVV